MSREYEEREKHYSSTVDLEVDFAARLTGAETLSGSQAVSILFASNGSVADLTLAAPTLSETKVITRASAGKCGSKVDDARWESYYIIRVQVTTSSGEIESELIKLVVYDAVERP